MDKAFGKLLAHIQSLNENEDLFDSRNMPQLSI
jgi:hypothetical protein